jgi:RNA polymerase sigma-70 factor (ECF subfamily)
MNPSQAAVPKLAGVEEDVSDLVEQARSGDHGAFEALYRRHVGRVYALCLRIFADRSKAEDLTQQIFIRVWMKLGSFRGESSFGSWLFRVSMNVVLNELKSEEARERRTAPAEEASELVSAREVPSNLQLDLESAIAVLPRQARTIFILHEIEGFSHEEIAAALGVAIGTCKAQLSRARRLLREALERP